MKIFMGVLYSALKQLLIRCYERQLVNGWEQVNWKTEIHLLTGDKTVLQKIDSYQIFTLLNPYVYFQNVLITCSNFMPHYAPIEQI